MVDPIIWSGLARSQGRDRPGVQLPLHDRVHGRRYDLEMQYGIRLARAA
jgi:hypothetical protein